MCVSYVCACIGVCVSGVCVWGCAHAVKGSYVAVLLGSPVESFRPGGGRGLESSDTISGAKGKGLVLGMRI